jgi:hypothetical protein
MAKKKKAVVRRIQNRDIVVTLMPGNPTVLIGGTDDMIAEWRCAVRDARTNKALTPSRVQMSGFPPASIDRMLVYSTPAGAQVLASGLAAWRFRFRGDQMYVNNPPQRFTCKMKVWVDALGWNYSSEWTYEEQVTDGASSVVRGK